MHLLSILALLAALSPLTTATDGGLPYWSVETYNDRYCKKMLSAHGDQTKDSECTNMKSVYKTDSISAHVPPGYILTVYALKNCKGDGYTTGGSWGCFQFWKEQFPEASEGRYTGETHYSEEGFKSYWMRKA